MLKQLRQNKTQYFRLRLSNEVQMTDEQFLRSCWSQKCALIIDGITTFIHVYVMINRNRKPSPSTFLTFYFFLSLNWRQRQYEIHTSFHGQ